jgi:predicted secreted Zn-dependent protease
MKIKYVAYIANHWTWWIVARRITEIKSERRSKGKDGKGKEMTVGGIVTLKLKLSIIIYPFWFY